MTTATTSGTVPATVSLPEGHMACVDCGVAVAPPHQHVEKVLTFGRVGAPMLPSDLTRDPTVISMTLCATCTARHDRAADLCATFPAVTRRIGSASIATAQVAAMLTVPEVLGRPAPSIPDAAALRALLRYFLAPGAACRWAMGFWPRMAPGRSPGVATERPWGHVTEPRDAADLREEMAKATSDWLAARIGHRRQVPPPTTAAAAAACGLCGVGTQPLRPGGHPRSVWHGPYRWSLGALGARGRRGQEVVEVWLCGTCEEHFEHAGYVVGATLTETAFLAHHRLHATGPAATLGLDIPGLLGWAASGRPPGAPFGHVPDDILDEARDLLTAV